MGISSIRGIDVQTAVSLFEKDITDNYDYFQGLKSNIELLVQEKEKLVRDGKNLKIEQDGKREEAQKKLLEIQAEHDSKNDEVKAYSNLRKKGITDDTLMAWGRIIETTNLTLEVVEAELNSQASLVKKATEMQLRIDELAKEEKLLSSTVKDLEMKKAMVDSSVNEANLLLIKLTKDMVGKVKQLVDQASPALEKLSKSLETGRAIGELEAILPIWKLLYEDDISKGEVEAIIRLLLEKYRGWILRNEPESSSKTLLSSIDGLISNLSGSYPAVRRSRD